VSSAPDLPSDGEGVSAATSSDQLTVTVDRSAQPPRVALVGELDPHTAPALEQAIDQVLEGRDDTATDLVLDLSGLAFVDSSGLRVLISAQHQLAERGGTLTLHDPSPTVRRLLEITGLIDHISITER
jgi:anti-sigma B factor antagonist